MLNLTNHWVFSLNFFCNAILLHSRFFACCKDHEPLNSTQFSAGGGPGPRFGGQKAGFTPRHACPNCLLSNPSARDRKAGLLKDPSLKIAS
eukprot:1159129-Pelagomonas_calceolata.AAC.15